MGRLVVVCVGGKIICICVYMLYLYKPQAETAPSPPLSHFLDTVPLPSQKQQTST